jgi:SAM-dependent methyltransferase
MTTRTDAPAAWLAAKQAALQFSPAAPDPATGETPGATPESAVPNGTLFRNDFTLDDLGVFDGATLREIVSGGAFGVSREVLARALHGGPPALIRRVAACLDRRERAGFLAVLRRPVLAEDTEAARHELLDALFWELTYWQRPEVYAELTCGERLHPGIFRRLAPWLRGRTVLDAGAGTGRASIECLRHGAARVYAMEPSPGLRALLEEKAARTPDCRQFIPLAGRFDAIPLQDNSVDLSIACSAFTADPAQGGEPGLAELMRVTRPGGRIVVIWPGPEEYGWLAAHGFRYEAVPLRTEMTVRFHSWWRAVRLAWRFYGRRLAVLRYLLTHPTPDVPFSVLGFSPPHDFCWLRVPGQRQPC